MSSINDFFSFYGIGTFRSEVQPDATETSMMNVGGYLPVVGTVIGLARIAQLKEGRKNHSIPKLALVGLGIRCVLEMLGIALLLAPIDIGCSLARLVRNHIDARRTARAATV
jgi:hypothetical protein